MERRVAFETLNSVCEEYGSPIQVIRFENVVKAMVDLFINSNRKFDQELFDTRPRFRELLGALRAKYEDRDRGGLYRYKTLEPEELAIEKEGPIQTDLFEEKKDLFDHGVVVVGKHREINPQSRLVQELMRHYVVDFIKRISAHPCCHGGEKGWSPRKSLETLMPFKSLFSFDLESAFDNVDILDVFGFYYEHPGMDILSKEHRAAISSFLSVVSTAEKIVSNTDMVAVLPQGASHSCALFNRLLGPIYKELSAKAAEYGFKITGWIDDINIASPDDLPVERFFGAIRIVEARGRPVSKTKIRHQRAKNTPIYALGQIIEEGRIFSNSRIGRKLNKLPPISYEAFSNADYVKWELSDIS